MQYLHKAIMCQDVVKIETTGKGVTIELVRGDMKSMARGGMTNMRQGVTTMTTNNQRRHAPSIGHLTGLVRQCTACAATALSTSTKLDSSSISRWFWPL